MNAFPPHSHAATLEASLDLVNTLELTDRLPVEHLPTADDALDFFAQHGLAHADDLRRQLGREGASRWLARVHAARAALRELWDAQVEGRAPAAAALDELNVVLTRGPHLELRPAPAGVSVVHRHTHEDPTGEALVRVVTPVIEAIADGRTARFRICANDGCRWVFEDASRAGRRRWCDMSTCGNRAKVRRYRTRHRAPVATGPDDADADPA
jgi:predicted RNA-binding Zn ribbon-like protein